MKREGFKQEQATCLCGKELLPVPKRTLEMHHCDNCGRWWVCEKLTRHFDSAFNYSVTDHTWRLLTWRLESQ